MNLAAVCGDQSWTKVQVEKVRFRLFVLIPTRVFCVLAGLLVCWLARWLATNSQPPSPPAKPHPKPNIKKQKKLRNINIKTTIINKSTTQFKQTYIKITNQQINIKQTNQNKTSKNITTQRTSKYIINQL